MGCRAIHDDDGYDDDNNNIMMRKLCRVREIITVLGYKSAFVHYQSGKGV
jgi:hypothetical protein